MPISIDDYFQREIIKNARAAQQAIREISDMPRALVKSEMHALNDKLHKMSHPITHLHLKKSINGGGTLTHAATSKAAAAILNAREFRSFAAKQVNSCFKSRLLFKSNPDLARAFYEATLTGEISRQGKKLMAKGELVDKFDFRFDWLPKDLTVRGAKLRLAGNIAWVAQEMGLLKPVKLKVVFVGPVK
ncbi:hypothetical protein [Phaeobacter sp. B1627]|uniref:hypothetical protein n=1 Tax=Phaeobacter sp. B1627 TaxID=2583809 RepID=UPI00111B2B46|nr:hypothetical protein [Phaeobacter sp. B1627]TNJ48572.1 hypothetical protein FGE21_01075 [Phaeobacter sp. B1627]